MAIAACVGVVLQDASTETLKAMRSILETAKVTLQAEKTAKEAIDTFMTTSIATLQIPLIAANSLVSSVENSLQIIPKEWSDQCPDLGEMNKSISDTVGTVTKPLKNYVNDANALIGQKITLAAEIVKINATIEFFDDIIKVIDDIIGNV